MKTIIRIILVVVVLLVLVGVGVAMFLGSIVKKGVETVGPKIAKVEMRLDSASISMLTGSGSLNGLFVGNPEGFKEPSAIKAGKISVSVKPMSVLSDKIVVESVEVLAPEITLYGFKGDNLQKILDNVQASIASVSGSSSGGKDGGADKSSGKKIVVTDLLIKDGKINAVLPVLGTVHMPMPTIHLTNLGVSTGGISAGELTSEVLKAVQHSALEVVAGAGKGAADAAKNVGKEVGKGVDNVTKGIGNLFKK